MRPLGDFAGHVKQIIGTIISNSTLSQRGTSIGWELGAEDLPRALAPLAEPQAQPDAFYQGLRLAAKELEKICQPASIPLVKKITLTLTSP